MHAWRRSRARRCTTRPSTPGVELAAKGQCVNQPYLGCREFDARVRLVTSPDGEPEALAAVDGDFGWMLYDMDFSRPADPRPMFFRAQLARGVLDLTKAEVRS